MKNWPFIRDNGYLYDILQDKRAVKYWARIFEKVYQGGIDTWDYPWTFSCWVQSGLTVLPNVNLVSNIGFDGDATHTKAAGSKIAKIPVYEIMFPLKHPMTMIRDDVADRWTDLNVVSMTGPIAKRILRKIWTLARRLRPLFHSSC